MQGAVVQFKGDGASEAGETETDIGPYVRCQWRAARGDSICGRAPGYDAQCTKNRRHVFIYFAIMHFSKTYAQLLSSLPPDLKENAIEYRQLKKLINQVVEELTSLGRCPP